MLSSESRDLATILAIGLVVILGPVVFITLTLGFLILTGNLASGQVSPLEFLELYVIDAILFIVFAYGIYRLSLWLVEHRLPAPIDRLESEDGRDSSDDTDPTNRDRT